MQLPPGNWFAPPGSNRNGIGLLPIMWSDGDVMKRIAAPMIGGIITSFLMELSSQSAMLLASLRDFPSCADNESNVGLF